MVLWHSKFMEEHNKSIYEANGFLATWYFALRASEEAARSERYRRPLTIIVVQASALARLRLEKWLADQMRATDLICRGPGDQYFILLTETDDSNAWEVSQRLLEYNDKVSLSLATLPSDTE